jgi:hypothetical protein
MGTSQQCTLGDIRLGKDEPIPSETTSPRQHIITDFTPSASCMRMIERVANGIVGIETVVKSNREDASFTLVLEPGEDPTDVGEAFVRAFKEASQLIQDDDRRHYVLADRRLDPSIANAAGIHSKSRGPQYSIDS